MTISSYPSRPENPKPTVFVKPDGSTFTLGSIRGLLGLGLTGIVLQHGENALKIPRVEAITEQSDGDRYYVQCDNEMNIEQMGNEKQIYARLGSHAGIVPCLQISADGIELAYLKNGSLDQYLRNHGPATDNMKAEWLRSLVDTLCYIHGRGVRVHDIALRNILVDDSLSLRFVDFGQSSLVGIDFDPPELQPDKQSSISGLLSTSTAPQDEREDSDACIDIFHLSFVMYSIIVWKKHNYHFYSPAPTGFSSDKRSNRSLKLRWPSLVDLPSTNGLLCGNVILKCWTRGYRSVEEMRDQLYVALGTLQRFPMELKES